MKIAEVKTGFRKEIVIEEIEDGDLRILTKKRYFFDWKKLKGTTIYKLRIAGEEDILGALGLTDIHQEKRIEIKLLASSIENTGKNKVYDRIAGCFIAYSCRMAKIKYGDLACVSLVPKTLLKAHYIKKYQMIDAGWQLFLEGKPLNDIILKYSL